MTKIAIFGGGCFWCTEAVFQMIRGVKSVTSGYAGGAKENPTYAEISTGKTGHAEVIKIEYDPAMIDYSDLLTVFFGSHDPTTLNRQGADIGTQYRSVIFTMDKEQEDKAKKIISDINASSTEGKPIVTEVVPFTNFYPAEGYHQNYYQSNKTAMYCDLVINPKLEKVQKKFANLLMQNQDENTWREKLTPEQYRVLREKGTEAPFSGKLQAPGPDGLYRCVACDNPLFEKDAKFESGTGWPSFDQAIPGSIIEEEDMSLGMHRVEILCSKCRSHLGHVFNDGPTKTGQRYCINSVCLS